MNAIGRVILITAICAASSVPVMADEGMWMVQELDGISKALKKEGLKLSPKDIYNEGANALSDAVVAVDGGTGTGSMVSADGLMITNHHVAYSDISKLSTPEKNILEDGFWAASMEEEIPVPGKTVSFLKRSFDVTEEVNEIIRKLKDEGKWGVMSMRRVYREIEMKYGGEPGQEASCSSLWGGKRYVMYIYDVYTDVRLAGCPPASIGAFGGEYDNWNWPQHKGDFALYRVYAGKDGKPAEYSRDNEPLRPSVYLKVSSKGVRENDYSMILGYPFKTGRYLSSEGIREKQEIRNPIVVKNRHERMEIMQRHMKRNKKVRLSYSDSYFNLANYADYAKWENKCLKRFDVIGRRGAEEAEMRKWIEADSARMKKYGSLFSDLERAYSCRAEAVRGLNYYRETWLGPSEGLLVANRVESYLAKLVRTGRDTLDINAKDAMGIRRGHLALSGNFDRNTDRDIFVQMFKNFTDSVPGKDWGAALTEMYEAAGGDAVKMAENAYDNSFCTSPEAYRDFFSESRPVSEVAKDPMVALAGALPVHSFIDAVESAEKKAGVEVSKGERLFAEAYYEYKEAMGAAQYPNANSTMRLTYGTVCSLDPSDAVRYDFRSSSDGILEKYDPSVYEWQADSRLRGLLEKKDWGRWGSEGKLWVNFITDNDISGGNSGSPVLNAKGELIGLAFDGNRESMAGDIWFNPETTRTVCVDIRYVMWVIEKYAGADRFISEIGF